MPSKANSSANRGFERSLPPISLKQIVSIQSGQEDQGLGSATHNEETSNMFGRRLTLPIAMQESKQRKQKSLVKDRSSSSLRSLGSDKSKLFTFPSMQGQLADADCAESIEQPRFDQVVRMQSRLDQIDQIMHREGLKDRELNPKKGLRMNDY